MFSEAQYTNEQEFEEANSEQEIGSRAWILELNNSFEVCVAGEELRHLLTEPRMHQIPHTPQFCQYLLEWDERMLPLFDLGAWLQTGNETVSLIEQEYAQKNMVFAVLGYNQSSTRIAYGAIALSRPPTLTFVKDSEFTDLNDSLLEKKGIINSNFKYQNRAIPIINIKRIFSDLFE
jgi:chemotaxis signal transduction protein